MKGGAVILVCHNRRDSVVGETDSCLPFALRNKTAMSVPSQFGPPPQPPRGGGSCRTVLIVLLAVGVLMMGCCGTFFGALLLFYGRASTAIEQVKASIQENTPPVLIAPRWEMDWMVMEELTRCYTTSIDAVAANEQVIAQLGQPLENPNDATTMFRRERTGTLSGEEEPIEYDIKGPKGTAVVRVVSGRSEAGRQGYQPGGSYRPKKITVKLRDGTEIDVPTPAERQ
jgi:hypothetical protein